MNKAGYFSSLFTFAAIATAPLLVTSTGCIPGTSRADDKRDQAVETPSISSGDRFQAAAANNASKGKLPPTAQEVPPAVAAAYDYAHRHEGVAILVFQGEEDVQDPDEKGALFMRGLARRGISARIFIQEIDRPRGGIEFFVDDHDQELDTATTLLVANSQLDTEGKVRAAFAKVLHMFQEAHSGSTLHLTQD